ncbi:unnamed protein product [Rotaria sp. Silwood1]|nr:unnamed protein product [Rotaria sp. Silwood1]
MVTLGRPFHLGMLYDVRSDKIITGATLWDPQNLTNHTSTRKQPYTGYEIIAEDSFQNKLHALGVEASLKLSMLSGLISISGSAKYAEDSQRTNHKTRLTLKYSTTTHFEQLTMKHLGKGNLNHPDLHDIDLATHVVTGVVYGAEAFFVFDRTLSKGESRKEIGGTLRAMINKIPIFKIEGEPKLNLTDQEKNFVDKLNCKFYGDFHLDENPSTFAEAVRIYRELPSRLGKANENAIPKKVWLYPLSLLDSKAMRFVREISSKLVDSSISVIENLHSLEVQALDLSKNSIFTHFSHMKEDLLDFAARLSEFQRNLKQKIELYLPKLRGSTSIQESVLFNLFKQVDSSPFNKQKLESWLKEKREAIAIITTLVENLTKDRSFNITIGSSSLSEVIGDTRYDYICCLSFRLIEKDDPQLSAMDNYLHNNKSKVNSSHGRQKRKPWFEDRRLVPKIRKNIRQFIEFAEANNVENGKIKFIVVEQYSVDHVNKSTELILYDNGSEKEGFIIPSKPDAPYVKNVTDNSVTLGWADAADGTEKIRKYKVIYRKHSNASFIDKHENEKEEKWSEVQSITAIGLSAISGLSEPIETLTKKVNNAQWAQNGVTVAGDHGRGNATNQLYYPEGLFVDDDQTIVIADTWNHRIIQWKIGDTHGQVVAGGNGKGNRLDQLKYPTDVLIDKETDSVIICDWLNRRVVRWSRRNGTAQGEIIINNITCWGLAMDDQTYLYISDIREHEVRRYQIGDKNGIIVAGGNGAGAGLNQLDWPTCVFVDRQHTVYVSDSNNHRVMKWNNGAKEGIVVAGGQGKGNTLTQLSNPYGLFVDTLGTLYVADWPNHRVMRWPEGAKQGTVIMGGNSSGAEANQFNWPRGIVKLQILNYLFHE